MTSHAIYKLNLISFYSESSRKMTDVDDDTELRKLIQSNQKNKDELETIEIMNLLRKKKKKRKKRQQKTISDEEILDDDVSELNSDKATKRKKLNKKTVFMKFIKKAVHEESIRL